MVRGLRVVFNPNPVARVLYSYRVPEPGAHGTVTAARTAGGVRTYVDGPGGGLVYVEWEPDGLVCGISMRDLTLEPGETSASESDGQKRIGRAAPGREAMAQRMRATARNAPVSGSNRRREAEGGEAR